jgi:hypothetical protein
MLMTITRITLITLFVALLSWPSTTLAQWNNACPKETEPQAALMGLTNGQFALVRFSDWAVKYLDQIGDREMLYGLAYYCDAKKAVACMGPSYPRYIVIIDLTKCSTTLFEPKGIDGAQSNILYFWIDPRDPAGFYLLTSDKYNYYDEYEQSDSAHLAYNRFDLSKGTWSRGSFAFDQASCFTLPAGMQSTPDAIIAAQSQAREEKVQLKGGQLFNRMEQDRKSLETVLKGASIIRGNDFQSRTHGDTDAILYVGRTFQLCRTNGKLGMTKVTSEGAKVLRASPKGLTGRDGLILVPDAVALLPDIPSCFK